MLEELKKSNIYAKSLKRSDSIRLIIIKGSVDYDSTEPLSQFLTPIVQDMKESIIVFDMSGINYMSSTAFGMFVKLLKSCKNKNIELYIMNISPKVLSVFKLLGFSNFFNFISSYDDIKHKVEKIENVFPFTGKCEICEKKFKITKPGKFRCPACRGIFKVNDIGEIWFF